MIDLFLVSSIDECRRAAAAVAAPHRPGPAAGAGSVLLVHDPALIPEVEAPLTEDKDFGEFAARFDRTIDLGQLVWPLLPGQFSPRDSELHIWERVLRSHWDLGDAALRLRLPTVDSGPADALRRIFPDAAICRVPPAPDARAGTGPERDHGHAGG